jgi:DNA-binding transcriptional MocR family regulator
VTFGRGEETSPEDIALGEWWKSDGALYRKLALAFRERLEQGGIPLGIHLPAERTLAQSLNVSRTTVVRAYALLRDEGWIDSRHGSGHITRHPQHRTSDPYENTLLRESFASNPLVRSTSPANSSGVIDFTVSRMLAVNPLLSELMRAAQGELDHIVRATGYVPQGVPRLRTAVANYLEHTFGLPTSAEQILITSGSQQSRWLAAQAYAPHGENVLIESPTSVGTADIFRMVGANISPWRVSAEGFSLSRFDALLRETRPRLVLVSPTNHSPTGATMTTDQREQLVALITAAKVTTIDDQTFADVVLGEGRPPRPLASFASDAPILTIGSLSALFWPGMRVGWIRAAEPVVENLTRVRSVVDMGGSPITQEIAAELFESIGEVRASRAFAMGESLRLFLTESGQHLPQWRVHPPRGGLSLWFHIPYGSAREFAQIALLHGVSIVPGSAVTIDGSDDEHVRAQFLQDPSDIRIGVRRLGQAWAAYSAQRKGGARP